MLRFSADIGQFIQHGSQALSYGIGSFCVLPDADICEMLRSASM